MKRTLSPITIAAVVAGLALGAAGRLDPAKRQEIAKPILDEAVKQGTLPAKARDRVLDHLGKQRP